MIVASQSSQAAQIKGRIAARIEAGLYPREIEFCVISDPEGGRIGSGGATILAAYELRDRLAGGEAALVINAGGESRRMPAYALEAKLFAPIPLPSSSRIPPVILDYQIGLFLRYPWREGELIVTSGDVTIDFDTDLIPEERGEIYGFAKPESFELGSQHGVYKFDRNRAKVVDFFQKESAEFLSENASLEGSRSCALDIGIVGFSPAGLERLFELAQARLADDATLFELLQEGRVGLDLYVELLMAFLANMPIQRYRDKVRAHSRLDDPSFEIIHSAFRGVDFRAYLTRRTQFLHFGSLPEYPLSCEELASGGALPFYVGEDAEIRPVLSEAAIRFNSIDSACVPQPGARHIYLESCMRTEIGAAAGLNLFIGLVDRRFSSPVAAGICLDERRTSQGRILLVYGLKDTWRPQMDPQKLIYCGLGIDRWVAERGLELEQIFPSSATRRDVFHDLWDARLYVAGADEHFAEGYWIPAKADAQWRDRFTAGPRTSIREVTDAEKLSDREERRAEIRQELLREGIASGHGWLSVSEWDFCQALRDVDTDALRDICEKSDDDLVRIYRRRLLDSLCSERTVADAVVGLHVDYLAGGDAPLRLRRSVKLDQIVWARSPVRLDLAGGWTDTPPFTLREGGEVVNVAVNLNDQPPIQVFCRPADERSIRIHSIDLGVDETILRFDQLEDFSSPSSPFALPKAALCLLGLMADKAGGATLAEELDRIGCGLELSLLSAVPKGSGLGTSSILGATILGALERFFGLKVEQGELFRQVLQLEQMLTTGGGWQDQIGGVTGGVKYISSASGLRPNPIIYQLDPFIFMDPDLSSRFSLYYTGITRLAKNILQEVVNRVNSMEPAYLFTLRYLKHLARRAREAISRRDIHMLGLVLGESWEANKLVHPSTTNEEVEALLNSLAGLYSSMKLLGAGGGGYILFFSDSAETARRLRDRLSSIDHERARVVDMSINPLGLRVTVS
jgi:galactokinase/mevalonate kinase-like predicted kinase